MDLSTHQLKQIHEGRDSMSLQIGTFHAPGQRVRVNSNASHYAGIEGVILARDTANDESVGAMAALYHVAIDGHDSRHAKVFWGIELDATGRDPGTDNTVVLSAQPSRSGISVIYFDTIEQALDWRKRHGGWVFSAETATLWFSTAFTPTTIMMHLGTRNISGRLL